MGAKKNNKGFTITEIVIATVIFVAVFAALALMLNSSRAETSKSINYLRAMQLAQETIDWINSTPFEEVTENKLSTISGSLVDSYTNKSVPIPIGENANNTVTDPEYPEDYSKCYYYRTIKIDELNNVPNGRFIKKVTVGIYWNESKVPKQLVAASGEPDRMRKIVLSTIIFNEKEYY